MHTYICIYILEKIFLFESQLTGLAAQQNCFCSVYLAKFIVVRHPLWSPARPVSSSKGSLHAPQLTAGFVLGAIDDCWYTSFVVSTDKRQATAVQLPLCACRQLLRICPKFWSDNNGVMWARGLLARRPAAPMCWLNWARTSFKVRCVGKFAYNKSETAAPATEKVSGLIAAFVF